MTNIGFSTGAIAKGKFWAALKLLEEAQVGAVELSALRLEELEPLVSALPAINLSSFAFVSLHCPSSFAEEDEKYILDLLERVAERNIPIVVHPDVIYNPLRWAPLGSLLLIENMDKRKAVGRTVHEMNKWFDVLPNSRMCLDVGHARQVDPSLLELSLLLSVFAERIAELHISEVNTQSQHEPISDGAVSAFRALADWIPVGVPVIIESLIDRGQSTIRKEIEQAYRALFGTHNVSNANEASGVSNSASAIAK